MRDAETRVNAVRSLAAVVCTLGVAPTPTNAPAPAPTAAPAGLLPADAAVEAVVSALLSSLDDYCTDNRGDVGSWVREAALRALPEVTLRVAAADAAALGAGALPRKIAGAALKQAAEKIDRMRDAAARSLGRMLHESSGTHGAPPPLAGAPDSEALRKAFPLVSSPPTSFEAAPWPALASLLRTAPSYRSELVQGLIVSMGGLGDSVSKLSSAAVLAEISADTALAAAFVGEIAAVLSTTAKCAFCFLCSILLCFVCLGCVFSRLCVCRSVPCSGLRVRVLLIRSDALINSRSPVYPPTPYPTQKGGPGVPPRPPNPRRPLHPGRKRPEEHSGRRARRGAAGCAAKRAAGRRSGGGGGGDAFSRCSSRCPVAAGGCRGAGRDPRGAACRAHPPAGARNEITDIAVCLSGHFLLEGEGRTVPRGRLLSTPLSRPGLVANERSANWTRE